MVDIHCHSCGGFITDPRRITHRLPSHTLPWHCPPAAAARVRRQSSTGPRRGTCRRRACRGPITVAPDKRARQGVVSSALSLVLLPVVFALPRYDTDAQDLACLLLGVVTRSPNEPHGVDLRRLRRRSLRLAAFRSNPAVPTG